MAAERAPHGLGPKLRDARERRGLSLRDVATTTKISVNVLDALERDDVSRLPAGIFGRAFVRAFADAVGLDPEGAVREFVAQFPAETTAAGLSAAVPIEDHQALESDRRLASAFLLLALFSIPIAGALLYFANSGRGAPTSDAPSVASSQTSATHATDIALTPERVEPQADAAPLTIEIVATRPAWVSALADDRAQFQEVLPAGDNRSVEAQEQIVLRIGDAGAVRLVINGKAARPLGPPGVVTTLRVNTSNYKTFLVEQ
jgi:cytoskeletal protein RodZ